MPSVVRDALEAEESMVRALGVSAALVLIDPAIRAAPLGAVGAIGDSLTHEYSSWVPLLGPSNGINNYDTTMLAWPEHLALSGVDFGPWVDFFGIAKLTYNAAIGGTPSDAADSSENGRLEVGTLYIGIGSNNFLHNNRQRFGLPEGLYRLVYNGAADPAYDPLEDALVAATVLQTIEHISTAAAHAETAYGSLQFVFSTLPDLGLTPNYQNQFPDATRRAAVSQVFAAINQGILTVAASYGAPTIDLSLITDLAVSGGFELAGQPIVAGADASATTPGTVMARAS